MRFVVACVAALLLAACYGPDPNLTDAGKGKPELALAFPAKTTAGTTETAELTVSNPGPAPMDSVVVTFSRLGDPKLPPPLVDVTARNQPGTVLDVTPEPNAVSPDGIVYTFDGLDEGEAVTISFRLSIPPTTGLAGNAILVYEGSDPDRAKGVRLETEVGG